MHQPWARRAGASGVGLGQVAIPVFLRCLEEGQRDCSENQEWRPVRALGKGLELCGQKIFPEAGPQDKQGLNSLVPPGTSPRVRQKASVQGVGDWHWEPRDHS